ncbi:DUF4249 family protein [Fodinibius sediminis]|uniref:DUF4249 domain-containing protein n=1 Tax=Fodinibius sediminis TaxID=1214077 RepID=A0A521DWA2_9BACT|nr:DUF4249 family protein [Fodinibius sediminis]SMO75993.1 protein of unknown function [Fodinibius sediminis]
MYRILFLAMVSVTLLYGCELYQQDRYKEYYVVESYLVAHNSLPEVLLSKTVPLEEEYSYKDAAIDNAEVEVRWLNADSTIRRRYPYTFSKDGIYAPVQSATVREKQLYQLLVTLPSGDSIEAKTFVPGDFKTVNRDELSDRYVYQGDEQIEITTTPSGYITDRQTYYVFTIVAEETDSTNLTPFYADLVEEQDNSIENFYINSSGIINEGNYERNSDNNISLKVPWISFSFYGHNAVVANAIDDNMYDFLRSQSVQTGGTSLSPGEIQNIRYNINGGIGIFGSLASDTNRFQILRPSP